MADPRQLRLQRRAEFFKQASEETDQEIKDLQLDAGLTDLSPFQKGLDMNPAELSDRIRDLATAKAQRARAVGQGAQAVLDQSVRDNLFRGFGAAFSDFSVGTNRLRELQATEDEARRTALTATPVAEAEAGVVEATGELDVLEAERQLKQEAEQRRIQNVATSRAEEARILQEKMRPVDDAIARKRQAEEDALAQLEKESIIAKNRATARKYNAEAQEAAATAAGGGTGKAAASVQLLREKQRPVNQFTAYLSTLDELPAIESELELLTADTDEAKEYRKQFGKTLPGEDNPVAERILELQDQKNEVLKTRSQAYATYRAQIRRTADKSELQSITDNIEMLLAEDDALTAQGQPILDPEQRVTLERMQALAELRFEELPKR